MRHGKVSGDDAQITGAPDINLQSGCASNACFVRQIQKNAKQDISFRKNLRWSLIDNLQSGGDFQLIRYLMHQDDARLGGRHLNKIVKHRLAEIYCLFQ